LLVYIHTDFQVRKNYIYFSFNFKIIVTCYSSDKVS
jgi:hypothetical protein